jgi:hypothetical protein
MIQAHSVVIQKLIPNAFYPAPSASSGKENKSTSPTARFTSAVLLISNRRQKKANARSTWLMKQSTSGGLSRKAAIQNSSWMGLMPTPPRPTISITETVSGVISTFGLEAVRPHLGHRGSVEHHRRTTWTKKAHGGEPFHDYSGSRAQNQGGLTLPSQMVHTPRPI